MSDGLRAANLPALLCVLYQLTGQRHWLKDPYRPTRPRGLDDHDDGGFAPTVQAEIRAAAARAIAAWEGGEAAAVPTPDHETLVELMSACMGDPVPAEYAPMVAAEMGFGDELIRSAAPTSRRVVVIGAGVSGMLVAHRLRADGHAVTVLEKNHDVGGTWLENTYPGCGVDTPSQLYELSFLPHDWSAHFAKRDEIQHYMGQIADRLDLRRLIRLGTTVTAAHYDDAARSWAVICADGARLHCDVVITAVGQLNRPRLPELPGLDDFGGVVCHSARWPADLDVTGRRVAVIGSGATAMQLVPQLAESADHVDVYQRSPGWVAPNAKYFAPITADVRELTDSIPFYRAWLRFRLAWAFNDKVYPSLVIDPEWPRPDCAVNAHNDVYRRFFTAYLREQLGGREDLVEKCLPTYPPFGKRILIDNGWFAALRRPDVELHTDRVVEVTRRGIRTALGVEHPVDVIACATGFHATRPLAGIDVRGRDGRALDDQWAPDDPRAFLGLSAPGFPNLFFLYGPNTNLGHGGSYPVMAECQVRYLADLLAKAGDAAVECRTDTHDDYNARVDAAHEGLIWSHTGMQTWYRNSRGRVVANYPWRVVDYWESTRVADLADFELR